METPIKVVEKGGNRFKNITADMQVSEHVVDLG